MKKSTVPNRHMQGLIDRGNRADIDCDALLRSIDFSLASNPRCDTRVSSEIYTRFALRLMEITDDEFIRLGGISRTRPGTFAMMAHSVIHRVDLHTAVLNCGRFYRLFTDDLQFSLHDKNGSARYSIHFDDPMLDWDHTTTECLLVVFHRFFSWLIGTPLKLDHVELSYTSYANLREYRYLFGCPIRFNAQSNSLVFSSRYLQYSTRQTSETLKHFLHDALNKLITLSIDSRSRAEQVINLLHKSLLQKNLLHKNISQPFPNFETIATFLHASPQTVRRQLKKENTSYQNIKDSIRCKAAIALLINSPASIDDIAEISGFSASDAFHRAFKRWTGLTPGVYRQQAGNAHEGHS